MAAGRRSVGRRLRLLQGAHPARYRGNQTEGSQVTSVAISGAPVVFTQVVPWKDDSALALKQTYRFKGWKLTLDINDTKLYNNTTSRLMVDKDTSVYAVFEEESVYATPLTASELIITQTGADTVSVTVPVGRGLRGKICIPSTISWSPTGGTPSTFKVTGLLGSGIENDSAYMRGISEGQERFDGGNLSWLTRLTGVFFEGCSGNAGAIDYITEFPEYCFYKDASLRYVDIPASLTTIQKNAFQEVPLSAAMNNLKNVYYFFGVVFYAAFSGVSGEDNNFTLYLSNQLVSGTPDNQAGNFGGNCFNSEYIKNIVIGSASSPVTKIACNSTVNNVFNAAISSITVYVTSSVDQTILENRLRGFCENGANPEIIFRT